ncbi:MAG: protein translocase SEC61 complex subunit gamma [Acidilobaceae archaeon]
MVFGRVRGVVAAWRRILLLSRRPDREEYMQLLRLTFIGFVLIGVIGYMIHMIYILLTIQR